MSAGVSRFTSFAILFLTALNLSLGLLVFSKDPRRPANRWFALFVLSVSLWSVGLAGAYSTSSPHLTLLFGRLAFSGASLIPFCFLAFAKYFPSPTASPSRPLLRRLASIPAAFALLSFSPWLLADLSLDAGRLVSRHGPAYPAFALYYLSALGTSFVLFSRKFRRADGVARLQIKYLYLGAVLALAGGTTTNLVIPLVFGTSHFGGYGPLFVSLLIAFATHSIIRYRLMDIRVVVRQGIIYLLSVTVAGGFFVVLLMALSLATATSPAELPHLLHLSLVLLVAVLFQPLKERTQRALDRYVYRRRYDYLRAIRTATRAISALLDLDSLVHYLRDMTVATFQPETVAVYVRDGNRQFVQVARHRLIDSDPPGEPTAFPSDSPLVRILTDSRSYLLRDDVPDAPRTLTGDVTNRVLHELNIDLALPLFDGNHLIAMILVGPKLSGDPYFSDDIELMVTLAQQAAVALRNAQLYQEVTLARDYISNLLATLENGVIAVDATGVVTQFNPAAERLTSLPTSKAVNNTLDVLPAPLAASLAQTLATQGSRVQDEVTLLEDTGRLVPAVCSTSTLRDRDGRPLGAVMVFGDITHLKELEADKRRAERLASFGSLASGIAHEIKNPLVAIRTFAELLPDRYSDEDFRSGFAEIVVKEITRIDDLVARLRGLAAPPAPPFGTVDLAESIDETLTLLRAKLEQQNISVRKDFTAASSRVTGDPSQLKQLFLNLFLNAVDAIGASGTLAVKVSERFGANMSNGVIVDISDTGCGIPTDLLPKIFEPFVTSKRTGSGLGLAICRGIADAHGAKIRAFNNEGYGGATIRLEFSLPSSPLSLTLKPD